MMHLILLSAALGVAWGIRQIATIPTGIATAT